MEYQSLRILNKAKREKNMGEQNRKMDTAASEMKTKE